jgi:uncharacterized protein
VFLLDDTVVHSASDLAVAATCEFAALRRLDAKLKRIDPLDTDDPLMERAARLGDDHELGWLARYREDLATRGGRLVEIERPGQDAYKNAAVLRAKHEQTLDAVRSGADVVFQGGFFDGRFHGWSDFIERQDDGTYAVLDTKLARHAKVTAALQLAAYGDQLLREGIPVSPVAHLVLGDRTTTRHRLMDLIPAYRHRRARLETILDRHHQSDGPAVWDDGHHTACGRCADCEAEIERTRDVLLVAGLSVVQRSRLHTAGIRTIDDLAASDGDVPRIAAGTLNRLRAQARLQVRQAPPQGTAGPVEFEVIDGQRLAELPAPSPGDLFFDFEGDPLWNDGDVGQWGLEYLFGWVARPAAPDDTPPFRSLWAHDRAGEREALERFIDHITQRLAEHPDMHVYHYAPYETTALKRLAGRHGTREDELDALLRRDVFVDLYAVVRQAIRVSQPSYSIKKLEPLYMEAREGLDNAADSITDYAAACAARRQGDDARADALLDRIALYNEDDCVSTYLLLEWLRRQVPDGVERRVTDDKPEPIDRADPAVAALETALLARADAAADPADGTAMRMLAAALDYERREAKAFWWAHFDRLTAPVDEWTSSDVFIVDARRTAELTAEDELHTWAKTGKQRNPRRRLRLAGNVPHGGQIRPGDGWWTIYDAGCDGRATPTDGGRSWNECGTTVLAVEEERGLSIVEIEEGCRSDIPWGDLPMALVPASGNHGSVIKDALVALAAEVDASDGFVPGRPALDVLRRRPPFGAEAARASGRDGWVDFVVTALRSGSDGYLPVQGPPGTGKTWNGAAVIRELVNDGWRVGVVAQSHAAVENMLHAVHQAGLRRPHREEAELLGSGPMADAAEPSAIRCASCGCGRRRRRDDLGLRQHGQSRGSPARPPRRRRGGSVLLGAPHRRGAVCSASVAPRRPATAAAGEPGSAPGARERVGPRLDR